jgi:hypothetical protein
LTQLSNPHALMCEKCLSARVKEEGDSPSEMVIVCTNEDSDHFGHILSGGHVMCNVGVDLFKNH